MGSKPCDGCGAIITFGRDRNTGRWMPVDDDATPDGNIRFNDDDTVSVLGGERLANARAAGERLHLSHFVTCPERGRFRK